jgi:membrane protein implicated in regulation of membrane protease activity
MTWWAWALIGWLVLSLLVAVLVGRTIALAQRRQDAGDAAGGLLGDGGKAGSSVPPPRGENDEDGWRAPTI